MKSILEYLEPLETDFSDGDTTDYDMNEMRDVYIARVIAEGFTVVYPEENQLLIDIDSEQHYETFLHSLESLARNVAFPDCWRVSDKPSKSGLPRRHITIQMPISVTPWQRIALQAALGSDPMRELLSSLRLMRGDSHPTLFVEKGPESPVPYAEFPL